MAVIDIWFGRYNVDNNGIFIVCVVAVRNVPYVTVLDCNSFGY